MNSLHPLKLCESFAGAHEANLCADVVLGNEAIYFRIVEVGAFVLVRYAQAGFQDLESLLKDLVW